MNDWIKGACDQVDRLAAQSPYYQQLQKELRQLEPAYEAALKQLSKAEREIIISREYLISELAYQRTQAAYYYGRSL